MLEKPEPPAKSCNREAQDPEAAPVTVIIPTLNEEANLSYAVRSVRWAQSTIILDSGSTDQTLQVAADAGATVIQHRWDGYARQKNWAIEKIATTTPWILFLDADEAVTPALATEIIRITGGDPKTVPYSGFYINRYFIFLGERIKHCGYFPSWNLRLFRRGCARYEDVAVHEHMIINGKVGYLRGLLEHNDRRGLETYIAKHNRYSTLEAKALLAPEQSELHQSLLGSPPERKRFIRQKIYRNLPAKCVARFAWMYIIRLGFLDGIVGLRFCLFIAAHEFFTSIKLAELRRARKPAKQ